MCDIQISDKILGKITRLMVILPKIQFLRDYGSALVGKYSHTLYSRIYASFVEYTPLGGGRGGDHYPVQNTVLEKSYVIGTFVLIEP